MSQKKGGKLTNVIGYRVRVSINDGRQFAGQLLAFDKHMNLVISECEEFRRVKAKKAKQITGVDEEEEMKRVLGLVILRGEHVVSITVEGPPPSEEVKGPGLAAGPGTAAAAGRGIPLNPTMRMAPMAAAPPPPMGMVPPPGFAPPPGFPGFAPR